MTKLTKHMAAEAPVALASLVASTADGQVPVVPFSARVGGRRVIVTAVLERTAVVADHWRAERRLVRLGEVSVTSLRRDVGPAAAQRRVGCASAHRTAPIRSQPTACQASETHGQRRVRAGVQEVRLGRYERLSGGGR